MSAVSIAGLDLRVRLPERDDGAEPPPMHLRPASVEHLLAVERDLVPILEEGTRSPNFPPEYLPRAREVIRRFQTAQRLAQEKAQLLQEAHHARHVRDLFDSVKDKTREVQLESQRVLREVERGHRNDQVRRGGGGGGAPADPAAEKKRPPAVSARQHSSSIRAGPW